MCIKLIVNLQINTPETVAYTNNQNLTLHPINMLLPAWGRDNLEKKKNIMGKI